MSACSRIVRRFLRDESAATMVEYAIMVALIAAVAIVIIGGVGTKTNNAFTTLNNAF